MSFTAVHEARHTRHTCQSCQDRKARFSYRGTVKADKDHTLCFECFRRERERQRARGMARPSEAVPPAVAPMLANLRRLTGRQVAHRRAMLTAMSEQRARG